jgi:diguanylate cyclase (GGDEF)-like protein
MAAPKGTARNALIVAGLTAIAYFALLLLVVLLPGRVYSLNTERVLIGLIAAGLPLAVAVGLLLWRWARLMAGDLAYRDDLTGLPNRRAFITEADRHLKGAKAGNIGLVLLDIDRLKRLNDTCGHQAGDELLIIAAHQLQRAAKDDRIYRIGGDEFAIFVDRSRGGRLSRVIQALGSMDVEFRACNHVHSVSMSYGYASCTEGESFDSLFRRTDQRLYQQKETTADRRAAALAGASLVSRSSVPPPPPMGAGERHLALVHSKD